MGQWLPKHLQIHRSISSFSLQWELFINNVSSNYMTLIPFVEGTVICHWFTAIRILNQETMTYKVQHGHHSRNLKLFVDYLQRVNADTHFVQYKNILFLKCCPPQQHMHSCSLYGLSIYHLSIVLTEHVGTTENREQ